MKLHPSQRILVAILQEICAEAGIQLTPLSDHWVLRLEKQGVVRHIYGYNFESNSATAQLIASDKFAAYSVLSHCGVPVIPHRLFQRPALSGQEPLPAAVRAEIQAYFAAQAGNVVCKINPGSGGYQVLRARTPQELDSAITRLFHETRSICLSPFVEIRNEYRVFLHDQPKLVYCKHRPLVQGDGQHRLAELIALKYGELTTEREDLERIPVPGEQVELNWKHNLGQGARAEIIREAALLEQLQTLAQRAARALGIRFASIDIIETATGYAVLEVNSGIMMESFARQGPAEYALARELYRQAVQEMMQP